MLLLFFGRKCKFQVREPNTTLFMFSIYCRSKKKFKVLGYRILLSNNARKHGKGVSVKIELKSKFNNFVNSNDVRGSSSKIDLTRGGKIRLLRPTNRYGCQCQIDFLSNDFLFHKERPSNMIVVINKKLDFYQVK